MSAKKWLLTPLLFGLCSCVTQGGVLQLDTGKLVLSPMGEMGMVMDSVPAITHASTDAPLDMVDQLRRDFKANDLYYHECMVVPKRCDVTRISAPNSPRRADLTRRVRDFSVANIHARTDSGVALIRIDSLTIIDASVAGSVNAPAGSASTLARASRSFSSTAPASLTIESSVKVLKTAA